MLCFDAKHYGGKGKKTKMKNLTEGNIRKTFFLFAVPLVLSGILSQAYNVIDTAIAGKFLGDEGLAAIGATSALITVVSSLIWGYSTGFSVYLAGLFGKRDYLGIKNAVLTTLAVIAAIVFVICLPLIIFYKPVFAFLNVDAKISDATFAYYSVYMGGLFFILMNHFGTGIMNAFGESTYPMFMSIISAVINVAGNILSVTVLGMGPEGLALSSVIAALAVDVCFVFKIRKCFKKLGVTGRARLSLSYIKDAAPYNLPNSAQQVVMYLASFLISPLVNSLGSAATAGYTVVLKIYDVNSAMYMNATKTLSMYTAQCVGAGKTDKIKKGVSAAVLQNILFVVPVMLFCVAFPNLVCDVFFKENADPQAVDYAVSFARYFLPFIIFQLFCNLFHALFRGVKSMRYLFICTLFSTAVRVAFTVALMSSFEMNGVYAAWVISWIAEAILAYVIYLRGRWMPKSI